MSWNADGSFRSIMRGAPVDRFWTPIDEGNPDLPPHVWLTERKHHHGWIRVLEAMLIMVPGLQETVRELAGQRLFTAEAREG